MAKYTNRAGRILDLNPNSNDTIMRVESGEMIPAVVTPEKEVIKEKAQVVTPTVLDKKELTAKYIAKFEKKPFAGWSAEKLQEKLNQ